MFIRHFETSHCGVILHSLIPLALGNSCVASDQESQAVDYARAEACGKSCGPGQKRADDTRKHEYRVIPRGNGSVAHFIGRASKGVFQRRKRCDRRARAGDRRFKYATR